MTKIKLCGLTRAQDIETACKLLPEYIGFVFAEKSKRYVTPEQAKSLKKALHPAVRAAGVFVDEDIDRVARLLASGTIDMAQLHGSEDDAYIARLRSLTDKPIIRAFIIDSTDDVKRAEQSAADYILLDSGRGSARVFDWTLLKDIRRPYFLAGGLNPDNAADAVRNLHPYAVDVSSGIETAGVKDIDKMTAFVDAVRKEDGI